MESKQDIQELVDTAKKVAREMENQPDQLVNRALLKLQRYNRKQLVYQFCDVSVKLGFTQEQIERMIRNLPQTA